jgi:ribose transport system permease protein
MVALPCRGRPAEIDELGTVRRNRRNRQAASTATCRSGGSVVYLCGFAAGAAGVLFTSRFGVGQSTAGLGYELDVIAAAVIGGVSLSGGRGTILGAIIGSLLMGILRNGLVLLNVSAYWQQVAIGLVIVIAVVMDRRTKR